MKQIYQPKLGFFGSLKVLELLKSEKDARQVLEELAKKLSEIEGYTADLSLRNEPEYTLFGDGTFSLSLQESKSILLRDSPEVFEEKRELGIDSLKYTREEVEELASQIEMESKFSSFTLSGMYKTNVNPVDLRLTLQDYLSPTKKIGTFSSHRTELYSLLGREASGEVIAQGRRGILMHNVGTSRMYTELRLLNHLRRLKSEYNLNLWKSLPSALNIWTSPMKLLILSSPERTSIAKPVFTEEGGIPIGPNEIDEIALRIKKQLSNVYITKEQRYLDNFKRYFLKLSWVADESRGLVELHPTGYSKAKLRLKGSKSSQKFAYDVIKNYLKEKKVEI